MCYHPLQLGMVKQDLLTCFVELWVHSPPPSRSAAGDAPQCRWPWDFPKFRNTMGIALALPIGLDPFSASTANPFTGTVRVQDSDRKLIAAYLAEAVSRSKTRLRSKESSYTAIFTLLSVSDAWSPGRKAFNGLLSRWRNTNSINQTLETALREANLHPLQLIAQQEDDPDEDATAGFTFTHLEIGRMNAVLADALFGEGAFTSKGSLPLRLENSLGILRSMICNRLRVTVKRARKNFEMLQEEADKLWEGMHSPFVVCLLFWRTICVSTLLIEYNIR